MREDKCIPIEEHKKALEEMAKEIILKLVPIRNVDDKFRLINEIERKYLNKGGEEEDED